MNRHQTLLAGLVLGTAAIAGTGGYFLGSPGTEVISEDANGVRTSGAPRLFGAFGGGGKDVDSKGKLKKQPLSEQAMRIELKSITTQSDPVQRLASLTRLLDGLNADTLPGVLRAFESIPMRPGYDQEYQLLLDSWATFDPEGAMAFAKEKGNSRTIAAGTLMGAALSSWARTNPGEALKWFNELPVEERNHQLTRGLLAGWAVTDPKAATDYILANHEQPGTQREQLIGVVVEQLLRTSTSAATNWAESIEEPKFREECFEELAEDWVSLDPAGLAEWLGKYATDDVAKEAMEDLARGWVSVDPDAATKWMMNLPEGAPKEFGVYEMVRTWAQNDLTAVGEWLNTVEDSAATNQGVRAYAQNLLQTAPEAAVGSASAITDPELRDQTLHELVPFWYSQNPEAAVAWADNNGFPVEHLQNQNFGGNMNFSPEQMQMIERSMRENPELQRQMEVRMRGVIEEQFGVEASGGGIEIIDSSATFEPAR